MKIVITGKYDEKWIDVDLNIELNDSGATEASVKRIIDHIAHCILHGVQVHRRGKPPIF